MPSAALSVTATPASVVLRNTYRLLGLSLLPTVVGAWLGTHYGASLLPSNPWMGALLFLAIAFGLMFAIRRTADSGLGVVLLMVFTGFMGFMAGPLVAHTLNYSNGAKLIMLASGGTAALFFGLSAIAQSGRYNFQSMGSFLMVGAVVLLVLALANIALQLPLLSLAISGMVILVFSGFMLYDVQRIVTGGETNYVIATLGVYLNLFNIFTGLLRLLGLLAGED